MARWAFLVPAATVLACSTSPGASGDPRAVSVVENPRDVAACEDLGGLLAVLGFDSRLEPSEAAVRRAIEDLRIQTASSGGDTLWLQQVDLRATEIRAGGRAFRCSSD